MEKLRALLGYIPLSYVGAILAVAYIILAAWVVWMDRRSHGGDWITLNGMGSYLITLPVSYLGEKLNRKLDYLDNAQMAFAICICALIPYLIGAALGRLGMLLAR